ncbi:MAG: hypothetical protein ACREI2_01445 [Nitrospiraceae bacterium]
MSKATETAIKLLESLPEEAQAQVVEALRQLVLEAQDEARWDALLRNRKKLNAAARQAREEAAAGKATPMDYEKL